MAESGSFPGACEAQKSGQSWRRCLQFLTHSPLAWGSKAPALPEADPGPVAGERRLSEGVKVSAEPLRSLAQGLTPPPLVAGTEELCDEGQAELQGAGTI